MGYDIQQYYSIHQNLTLEDLAKTNSRHTVNGLMRVISKVSTAHLNCTNIFIDLERTALNNDTIVVRLATLLEGAGCVRNIPKINKLFLFFYGVKTAVRLDFVSENKSFNASHIGSDKISCNPEIKYD